MDNGDRTGGVVPTVLGHGSEQDAQDLTPASGAHHEHGCSSAFRHEDTSGHPIEMFALGDNSWFQLVDLGECLANNRSCRFFKRAERSGHPATRGWDLIGTDDREGRSPSCGLVGRKFEGTFGAVRAVNPNDDPPLMLDARNSRVILMVLHDNHLASMVTTWVVGK